MPNNSRTMSRDGREKTLIRLMTFLVLFVDVSCDSREVHASSIENQRDLVSDSEDITTHLVENDLINVLREYSRKNEKLDQSGSLDDVKHINNINREQYEIDKSGPEVKQHGNTLNKRTRRNILRNRLRKRIRKSSKNRNEIFQGHNISRSRRSITWYENICKNFESAETDSYNNIETNDLITSANCDTTCHSRPDRSNMISEDNNLHAIHSVRKRSTTEGLIDMISPVNISSLIPDNKPYREIKIAVTLPANDSWLFSIRKVRPAIEIALEKTSAMIAQHNAVFTARFRDSNCAISDGINEAINFYVNNEMDVMFGPCCDYPLAPCARQAVYWNIPIISAGGFAVDFGNGKDMEYSTLTRLGSNHYTLVNFFMTILDNYEWTKMNTLYDPYGQAEVISRYCHIATNDLHWGIRGDNYSFTFAGIEKPMTLQAPELAQMIGKDIAGKFIVACIHVDV